jgi:hypothetical protein
MFHGHLTQGTQAEDISYWLAAGTQKTSLITLANVAGKCWMIEVNFEEATEEL